MYYSFYNTSRIIILNLQCYYYWCSPSISATRSFLHFPKVPSTHQLKFLIYFSLNGMISSMVPVPRFSIGIFLVVHCCETNYVEIALSNNCIVSHQSTGFGSVVLLLHLMLAGAKTSWRCNWAETFKMIHTLGQFTPDVIWELYQGCWTGHQHVPLHVAWIHSMLVGL